jgi:hypothetical protein
MRDQSGVTPARTVHNGVKIRGNFKLHTQNKAIGDPKKAEIIDNDFLNYIVRLVIARLEKLEHESMFIKLDSLPQDTICEEAATIRQEIMALKSRLIQLQERTS